MSQVRYGARSEEERRNRELEATSQGVWASSLTATYETDPEIVAAVLPRPLEPSGRPLVRVAMATVEIGDRPPFGAGTVAVAARHEGTEGDYALLMPMTTEQAVIGGRETFGEPKKLGQVTLTRQGDRVVGSMGRLGTTFVEVGGTVVEALPPPPELTRTAFYFKFLLDPAGKGFDSEPSLVYCHRTENARLVERVEGEVILRESRFDPVADLVVRQLVEITYSERRSAQRAEIVGRVPGEWLLPFVHQRYDDLSPVASR
ncbi:MAG TPA: acetoacetate decarboxylase family protein [Acidimicrobiales bacterium]|nr:acetoacetate decarboxylase family protein [Acidimicrobiales bacterium]